MTDGREALLMLAVDEAQRTVGSSLRGRTKLTKLVFLAEREAPNATASFVDPDAPFEFEPYNYGPFSKDVLRGLDDLKERGWIQVRTSPLDSLGKFVEFEYSLLEPGKSWLARYETNRPSSRALRTTIARYASWDRRKLVDYIYKAYPDGATE